MQEIQSRELDELLAVKLIKEMTYLELIANVVPVKKKNGQIMVRIDFRDLNKTCPKDSFPFPLPDIHLDQVVGLQMFSFIDGCSGYNQIPPFTLRLGSFVTEICPFGLKNT